MSTRIEIPEMGSDSFRDVTELDDATTAINHAEDNYRPVLKVGDETYEIARVTWDASAENMIIEALIET